MSFRLASLALVVASVALAQPPHEDFHFHGDPTRLARVDDNGGMGDGFSFNIEYDPTDSNSEDFCPHCRLTIMTCDPGIDLSLLARLGVASTDLESATGLVSSIQGVVAADPTGLAMTLQPGLTGDDLTSFVGEIRGAQTILGEALTRLEMLATLATPTFDWATADIEALVDAMSLQQDSAFDAEFTDPNDPRQLNSGVHVYTLAELLAGLAGQGVPMSVQDAIQSSLTSIPGLGTGLEISGDDDDVTAPVRYHGRHTDLNVEQRTYAVNGANAYLLVFTLSNETQRVMPRVDVAFIADFDIPPGGWDTQTQYDSLAHAVMLEDVVDWIEPEQHYWFGIAPAAVSLVGTPGSFSFSQYNLDTGMTLALTGSRRLDRFRWFLGDPRLTGDHDDATERGEKQGAIAFTLNGPMLPGDKRTIAFCMAAGDGGSAAAALPIYTANMTACRALYTALNPTCGDGVVTYPEECEGGALVGCTDDCHRMVCGDRRIDGSEECDDGNTDDGDGCSATCVREVCGNGIVQAGEECDDGNASNTDACTTECHIASCGDGYLRSCTGTECGGCSGYSRCWRGTFTFTDAPTPTSPYPELHDVPIQTLIAFDVASRDETTLATRSGVRLVTGPIHVEMTGHPSAVELARRISGETWQIDMLAAPGARMSAFSTSVLAGAGPIMDTTTPHLTFSAPLSGVDFATDAVGLPILGGTVLTNARAQLLSRAIVPTGGGLMGGPARGSIRGSAAASDPIESCDDGNASDYDSCTTTCVPAACGDGFVQPSNGEDCDEGAVSVSWCTDCHRVFLALCGNGTTEAANGEDCDDGNNIDGDGCSAVCTTERCGDGALSPSEQCDDGGNVDNDGCSALCHIESCGDNVVQISEECDTGASLSDTGACTTQCHTAVCGDGLVQAGVEQCDDGNLAAGDGCSATCANETCGDGLPGPHEECDDGNAVERDGCSPTCAREYCGDGLPGPNEQCDDGNPVNGDGCDIDCQLENLADCGDGSVGVGEQCDDGARADGDGCNSFCQLENPESCGDGHLDPGEGCDDGNTESGDGCTPRCVQEICGDNVHQWGEACDDGNQRGGDGCAPDCTIEPSTCGDGVQQWGEQCDGGDGCTDCQLDDPHSADLAHTCGNGVLDRGEQCDDGGREDGNGCGATCQTEASVCGNGGLDRGETCDDGNDVAGDGCTACAIEHPMLPTGGCGGCAVPRSSEPGWLWLFGLALLCVRRRRAR